MITPSVRQELRALDVDATDIGRFAMSEEFVQLDPDDALGLRYATYLQRPDFAYTKVHGDYFPLDAQRAYFAGVEGDPVATIYTSFLDRVAQDAGAIAARVGIASEELRAKIHAPSRVLNDACVGVPHRDLRDRFETLGLRYISANHTPTEIVGVPDHQAGSIARMPHGITWHRRPAIQAGRQNPRVLLAVDF